MHYKKIEEYDFRIPREYKAYLAFRDRLNDMGIKFAEYRYATEKHFADYYRKHKKTWNTISSQDKMQISQGIRGRSINEGMQMESMTIDEWLKSVEELI